MVTSRVYGLHPSPTLSIAAKAKMLREQGEDVISLSAGEPDFETPNHIKQAAIQAIQAGDTRYGPASGKPQLKDAVAAYLAERLNQDISNNNIIIGVGGKQLLFDSIAAVVAEGDEVILPCPYWVSFPDMIHFAGAYLKLLQGKEANHFVPTVDEIANTISSHTRLIILNSPHNPTGNVLSQSYLQEFAALMREYPEIFIISDETYEKLLYDELSYVSLRNIAPDLQERILIVASFSKAYAMTGWRLGYACGPVQLISYLSRIAGASTSGPVSFVQTAAIQALQGQQTCVEDMRQTFQNRRDLMASLLNDIENISFSKPQGAFYYFVNVQNYLNKVANISNSQQLAEFLLDNQKLAVVHGSAFGAEGYIRLSFAASDSHITEGIQRFKAGLKAIK